MNFLLNITYLLIIFSQFIILQDVMLYEINKSYQNKRSYSPSSQEKKLKLKVKKQNQSIHTRIKSASYSK